MTQGIETLRHFVDENKEIGRVIPAEYYPYIAKCNDDLGIIITSAVVKFNMPDVFNIFPRVENKLLDILRCLEKLFGNLDNLDIDIDAMNLEYPNFRVEKAEKAYENKISDYKIDLMKDMIEFFEDECRTKVNENVSFLKEHYEEESRDSATEEIVTFKKKEIWDTNACQECILSYHF